MATKLVFEKKKITLEVLFDVMNLTLSPTDRLSKRSGIIELNTDKNLTASQKNLLKAFLLTEGYKQDT